MHPASALSFLLLCSAVCLSTADDVHYLNEATVPYFTSPSMRCDHPRLNISDAPSDVESIFWIFPDGNNIHAAGDVDPLLYKFSAMSDSVLELYNLTALDIDDVHFGYYFCVVHFIADSSINPVAIRWALNVGGADFSELLDTYEENAIIGGIAAAVLLVVMGAGCLFWNYRYGKNDSEDDDDDEDEEEEKDLKKGAVYEMKAVPDDRANGSGQLHTNSAYSEGPEDSAVIDVHM